jgi:FAD:protein FMN transferase
VAEKSLPERLTKGAFDIISGVLRRAWTFDGGTKVPDQTSLNKILRHVGWHKVHWQAPVLSMQPGMQIDLGGVGKEYAVDICVARLKQHADFSCLVNFGGDCGVSRPPRHRRGWDVGIEGVDTPGQATLKVNLAAGGLATSGNAHRFIRHQGKKLSHILDARTGWPVCDAPRSVTVQADTCVEAGMLATLASLRGGSAGQMLEEAGAIHWLQP